MKQIVQNTSSSTIKGSGTKRVALAWCEDSMQAHNVLAGALEKSQNYTFDSFEVKDRTGSLLAYTREIGAVAVLFLWSPKLEQHFNLMGLLRLRLPTMAIALDRAPELLDDSLFDSWMMHGLPTSEACDLSFVTNPMTDESVSNSVVGDYNSALDRLIELGETRHDEAKWRRRLRIHTARVIDEIEARNSKVKRELDETHQVSHRNFLELNETRQIAHQNFLELDKTRQELSETHQVAHKLYLELGEMRSQLLGGYRFNEGPVELRLGLAIARTLRVPAQLIRRLLRRA
ncbi:hypothetical protein J2X72_001102 [Phyllobacterium sp. 1468]|uniref:hypothetical protein n=1 Tax=Phyllobacterium sp. 1468 TaxID=2817759 RepID=UPI00286259C6|nr:hypothetical protein [Phyllobacterium sp. 1468]MDR6632318.1 hypothetical protein [Phyllobacterium sp. 1468]